MTRNQIIIACCFAISFIAGVARGLLDDINIGNYVNTICK